MADDSICETKKKKNSMVGVNPNNPMPKRSSPRRNSPKRPPSPHRRKSGRSSPKKAPRRSSFSRHQHNYRGDPKNDVEDDETGTETNDVSDVFARLQSLTKVIESVKGSIDSGMPRVLAKVQSLSDTVEKMQENINSNTMKVDAVKLEVKELQGEVNLLAMKLSTLSDSMELGLPYQPVHAKGNLESM